MITTIVNELTAAGIRATSPDLAQDAAVKALQRHGQRPSIRNVKAVLDGLAHVSLEPVAEPADDQGLTVPTAEELAREAAWWVDTFFMYSLTFSAAWSFDNDDVDLDPVSTLPAGVRQTAFRAGMTVAAAHGVPDNPPTMRQVVNALIGRLARDGRLTR